MDQNLLQERLNTFLSLTHQLQSVLSQETQVIRELVQNGIWQQRPDRLHLMQRKEQLTNRYEALYKEWHLEFKNCLDGAQKDQLQGALEALDKVCIENQGALQGIYVLGERYLTGLRQHVIQRRKAATYSQGGVMKGVKKQAYAGQISNLELIEENTINMQS